MCKIRLASRFNQICANTCISHVKHQYFQDKDLVLHCFAPQGVILLVFVFSNDLKSCHFSVGCNARSGQCHPTVVSSYSVLFVIMEVSSNPSQLTVTLHMRL